MDKKLPMTGKNSNASPTIKVELEGLDKIVETALESENLLGKYERFAEHVMLSCAMPEIPRFTIHDEAIEGTPIPQAVDMLDNILVRYRRMTAWMRQNGIDPEAIAGKPDDKPSRN